MKKVFPFLLMTAVALVSCEKNADSDDLDNKFVVYTNYDKGANFGSFDTYYLPDSILIIGDKQMAEYWQDDNAQKIINAYAANMDSRGYVRIYNKEEADLGLQVSYVKSTYLVTNYGQPECGGGIQDIGVHHIGEIGGIGIIHMP